MVIARARRGACSGSLGVAAPVLAPMQFEILFSLPSKRRMLLKIAGLLSLRYPKHNSAYRTIRDDSAISSALRSPAPPP